MRCGHVLQNTYRNSISNQLLRYHKYVRGEMVPCCEAGEIRDGASWVRSLDNVALYQAEAAYACIVSVRNSLWDMEIDAHRRELLR